MKINKELLLHLNSKFNNPFFNFLISKWLSELNNSLYVLSYFSILVTCDELTLNSMLKILESNDLFDFSCPQSKNIHYFYKHKSKIYIDFSFKDIDNLNIRNKEIIRNPKCIDKIRIRFSDLHFSKVYEGQEFNQLYNSLLFTNNYNLNNLIL